MGNFFPRWTNFLPFKIAVALGVIGVGVVAGITAYWTPAYSRVQYTPDQPIPFDHSLHAGQLGMDCRYCHSHVERASHSNIPTSQTCWNCHQFVKNDSEKLAPLRAAMDPNSEDYTGKPIEWVRVHKVPDYAYFNHQVHVNRGISCVTCHGNVHEMEVVGQQEPMSMGWCLECHRNPEKYLRPLDQITNLDWAPEMEDRETFYGYLASLTGESEEELEERTKGKRLKAEGPLTQKEVGLQLKEAWGVQPPESCTACHR